MGGGLMVGFSYAPGSGMPFTIAHPLSSVDLLSAASEWQSKPFHPGNFPGVGGRSRGRRARDPGIPDPPEIVKKCIATGAWRHAVTAFSARNWCGRQVRRGGRQVRRGGRQVRRGGRQVRRRGRQVRRRGRQGSSALGTVTGSSAQKW